MRHGQRIFNLAQLEAERDSPIRAVRGGDFWRRRDNTPGPLNARFELFRRAEALGLIRRVDRRGRGEFWPTREALFALPRDSAARRRVLEAVVAAFRMDYEQHAPASDFVAGTDLKIMANGIVFGEILTIPYVFRAMGVP